jgi:hypothetical protein
VVAQGTCPSCGSRMGWPVGRMLDRPPMPLPKAEPWHPAAALRARPVSPRGATDPLPFSARRAAS